MAGALESRKQARKKVGDATHAMTLLMIDNEIDQNRKHMAKLQERLHVALPREQDALTKKISDNLRDKEDALARIEQVRTKIVNIRETRVVIEPTLSLKPVGLTKPLLVVLGIVLGLILGIFAAFFA